MKIATQASLQKNVAVMVTHQKQAQANKKIVVAQQKIAVAPAAKVRVIEQQSRAQQSQAKTPLAKPVAPLTGWARVRNHLMAKVKI